MAFSALKRKCGLICARSDDTSLRLTDAPPSPVPAPRHAGSLSSHPANDSGRLNPDQPEQPQIASEHAAAAPHADESDTFVDVADDHRHLGARLGELLVQRLVTNGIDMTGALTVGGQAPCCLTVWQTRRDRELEMSCDGLRYHRQEVRS